MMKLLNLLLAVTNYFLLSTCQSSHEFTSACREPTNVTEMYRMLRASVIEQSAISRDESTLGNEQHNFTKTALNDTCHHNRHSRLCNCPTRHELNFDPNRIPKILVQTSCCNEHEDNIAHWIIKCKEIYHDVRVLKRGGCIEGIYSYTLQWNRVPIGCSCQVHSNIFSAP